MFMIRDLQRELKRVGCYEGEIHGVRTKSTRDAMDRFTELANAKLPTHEPDIVLLSLVRGYAGNTGCDRSVITAAAPNAAPPPRAPPLDGYMALAGPPAEAPAPSAAPTPPQSPHVGAGQANTDGGLDCGTLEETGQLSGSLFMKTASVATRVSKLQYRWPL